MLGKIPIYVQDEIHARHYYGKSLLIDEILAKQCTVIDGSEFLINGIKRAHDDSLKINKSIILKKIQNSSSQNFKTI